MGLELVRDNLANVPWRDEDQKQYLRPVADVEEHRRLLRQKLVQEVAELLAVTHQLDLLEECADVYEVMLAMLGSSGMNSLDLAVAAENKRELRGGFSEGLVYVRS